MRSNFNYKSLSLGSDEIKIFKIPDLNKGWAQRTEHIEIPNHLVLKALNRAMRSPRTKEHIKDRLSRIKDHVEKLLLSEGTDETLDIGYEYFYIVKNELNMIKVGVSKTPQLRVTSITNGSGLLCKLLGYYIGSRTARDVEKEILDKFKKFKSYGEWFKAGEVTEQMIKEALPEDYREVV